MAARHSNQTKKRRKSYSEDELELRRYHSDVRKFKNWCYENGIEPKTFNTADGYDICILSRNEYCIGDSRISMTEDNESYYLSPQDYEKWKEG